MTAPTETLTLDELASVFRLLQDARCSLGDPSLRAKWGRERKRILDRIIEVRDHPDFRPEWLT